MIRLDLDAIRARCIAATKGPWSVSTLTHSNGTTVVESITGASEPQWSDYGDGEGEWYTDRLALVETDAGHYGPTMPDAQFIAHARADIPALLAYIENLESRVTYSVGETEWAHRIAVVEQKAEEARDEARAEVERLRADRDKWRDRYHAMRTDVGLSGDIEDEIAVAYRRGAEAMREACAHEASVCANHRGEKLADILSALPIPEEP